MTRTTNSRIAGATFLVYIAAGLTSLSLSVRATGGAGAVAAKLAGIAAHPTEARLIALLGFVQAFSALVLGVTLYALTREEDSDIATLGLVCRVAEGVVGGLSVAVMPTLYALATATGPDAPDPEATRVLARYLLRSDVGVPATFFAVGSTAFSYLLLRGRMVPSSLAWLGVVASALLVVLLPLDLVGWLPRRFGMAMWLPALVFELWLAAWLIAKGAAPSGRTSAASQPPTSPLPA